MLGLTSTYFEHEKTKMLQIDKSRLTARPALKIVCLQLPRSMYEKAIISEFGLYFTYWILCFSVIFFSYDPFFHMNDITKYISLFNSFHSYENIPIR